jgi:hypothetical protein
MISRRGPNSKKVGREGRCRKLCSVDGCKNQVIKGGVRTRHGAQVKRRFKTGCTHQAQNRGVYVKHVQVSNDTLVITLL